MVVHNTSPGLNLVPILSGVQIRNTIWKVDEVVLNKRLAVENNISRANFFYLSMSEKP